MFGAFVSYTKQTKEKEGCSLYNSRKRVMESVPEELTAIWSCSNESCKGWMRDNFVFSSQPTCVQCNSLMVKDEKMLSIVENTSPNQVKL